MSRFGLGSTLARLELDVVWVAMCVLGAILYAGSGFGGSSWERGLELGRTSLPMLVLGGA